MLKTKQIQFVLNDFKDEVTDIDIICIFLSPTLNYFLCPNKKGHVGVYNQKTNQLITQIYMGEYFS